MQQSTDVCNSLVILSINENNKEASPFRLEYDYLTPRPHMIILIQDNSVLLGQKKDKKKKNWSDLKQDAKPKLIRFLREAAKQFRKASIISLHYGEWQSAPHFHVHICVDQEEYLCLYKRDEPKLLKENTVVVTAHWAKLLKRPLAKINMTDYCEAVKQYPKENPYWNSDWRNAKEKIASNSIKHKRIQGNIEFHQTQPRIGFFTKDTHLSDQQLVDMIDTMFDFVHKYSIRRAHLVVATGSDLGHYEPEFSGKHIAFLVLKCEDYIGLHPQWKDWVCKVEGQTKQGTYVAPNLT